MEPVGSNVWTMTRTTRSTPTLADHRSPAQVKAMAVQRSTGFIPRSRHCLAHQPDGFGGSGHVASHDAAIAKVYA